MRLVGHEDGEEIGGFLYLVDGVRYPAISRVRDLRHGSYDRSAQHGAVDLNRAFFSPPSNALRACDPVQRPGWADRTADSRPPGCFYKSGPKDGSADDSESRRPRQTRPDRPGRRREDWPRHSTAREPVNSAV